MTITLEHHLMRRVAIGDILMRNAEGLREKKAVVVPGTEESTVEFTWIEFNNIVNRVANGLLELGVQKGDKVGVYSTNNFQFAILIFATFKIGAIIAPASAVTRGDDLVYIIKHSDSKYLF